MIGMNLQNNPQPTPQIAPALQAPADDGKLAKTYKDKIVMKVIYDNAKDLQTCYFDFLEKKTKITEGVMDILLKVEEDGSIAFAKITKDDFNDSTFENCVSRKLKSYYLSPPPLGINRYISYPLAFKSEATATKEAKERAERNMPPKILPVQ